MDFDIDVDANVDEDEDRYVDEDEGRYMDGSDEESDGSVVTYGGGGFYAFSGERRR